MTSTTNPIKCQSREKVGSRDARKLRAGGRLPASIQAEGDQAHLNIHLDCVEFERSRRQRVHLYDLDVGGEVQSAVVRELQWDAMGDELLHVEFKRVQRGVETESMVALSFYGQVKDGVLNQTLTEVPVLCIPSLIPDSIEVKVTGLEPGTHIKAGEPELPEGISLVIDPETEVAMVSAPKIVDLDEETPVDFDAAPEAGEAPSDESQAEGESEQDKGQE